MGHYPLQGRTLFITGGANGIGAETARQAARRGARLALVDVDGDAAERVASTLPAAIGIQADVRDYDSLEAAVALTVHTFGGIDVAMANAGIGTVGTAQTMPLEEIERIVDINLTGVLRTAKATLPHVVDRRGYFLITASLAAILHGPPLSHYTATKAGVEAFGNALRIELAGRGVDVGVAYFGFIDTAMVTEGNSNPVIEEWRKAHGRRGLMAKTLPVAGAGRAVVRGIERRARRIAYPQVIRGLIAIRALTPRIAEAVMRREDAAGLVAALDRAAPAAPAAQAEAALAEQADPRRLLS